MKYIGSESHIRNAKNASILGVNKLKELKMNRVSEYNINPNKCKLCNSDLPYEKKNKIFCNSSCAAKFNNKGRVLCESTKKMIGDKLKNCKHSDEHKSKITGNKNGRWKTGEFANESQTNRKCIVCGNEFIAHKLSEDKFSKSKCCSNDCHIKLKSNNTKTTTNERIINGTHKGWTTRNIISYPEQFFMGVLINNDIKFIHNHPINKRNLGLNDSHNYFLDFYIENKRIDLEIDGSQHKYREESDVIRDKVLNDNGYIVYRIKWKNIISDNGKEYMKNEIDKFLTFYNNQKDVNPTCGF